MELSDITLEGLPPDEIPELKALTNDRQRNFAVFYVANGGNGADAARRAGYSEKTASRTGGQIARQPGIRAAVRAVREWFFERMVMSKNEALYLLSETARGNLSDLLDANGQVDVRAVKRHGRIVESYDAGKGVVKVRDPRAAIETIGKVLGWFREDVSIRTESVTITMENMGK